MFYLDVCEAKNITIDSDILDVSIKNTIGAQGRVNPISPTQALYGSGGEYPFLPGVTRAAFVIEINAENKATIIEVQAHLLHVQQVIVQVADTVDDLSPDKEKVWFALY